MLPFPPLLMADRFREEIERSMLRFTKGLPQVVRPAADAVGRTPHDVVWTYRRARLLHYHPTQPQVRPRPLIMIYSLVNRPYILDLAPGGSFIEYLVNQGIDCYLLDWGVPEPEDSKLRFDDLVFDYIPDAVEAMRRQSKAREFSMLGYFLGGDIALLYASTHPRVALRNLICLATPADMRPMSLFDIWSDERYLNVDQMVDTLGNVPGELLQQSFRMLKPSADITSTLKLWQNLWNDEYVQGYRVMNQWTNDVVPFPGEAFRQWVKEIQRPNAYMNPGLLRLRDKPVDLGKIKASFLTIAAEKDDIVPLAATEPLIDLVGSEDKESIIVPGGHISLTAGRGAIKGLWPRVNAWLQARSG